MSRQYSSRADGSPFSGQTIEAVWQKGQAASGDSSLKKDTCGAKMQRQMYGKTSSTFGWEVDHIKPVALGGSDHIDNLQPLQWENNRFKSDKYPGKFCKVTYN